MTFDEWVIAAASLGLVFLAFLGLLALFDRITYRVLDGWLERIERVLRFRDDA